MKRIGRWVGTIIGALLFFYFCGVFIFYGRFLPCTTVNGQAIVMRKPSEVTLDLVSQTSRRRVELVEKNGNVTYVTFQKLGVKNASDLYFVDKKPQASWFWMASLWNPSVYEVPEQLLYDKQQIQKCVSQLNMVTGGPYRKISDMRVIMTEDGYDVVSSEDGYYVNQERLVDVIYQAICQNQFRIDLEKAGCYQVADAVITDVPVKLKLKDEKAVESLQLTLEFAFGVQEKIPSDVLQLAVYQGTDNAVYVNPAVISSYVNILAQRYNTKNQVRNFQTTGGELLHLQPSVRDSYRGYELDKMALLTSILEQCSDGISDVIMVPWISVGRELQNEYSDIGNTYLEISIVDQHMWFYQDGQLKIDTDVVTGLQEKEDWRTPVGIFEVLQLHRDYTMYYEDGSAPCEYFIQITSNGVGIHDSTRTSYGGQIYRTGGSHGCINTPFDVEKVIFDTLSEMENYHIPVIIY